MRTVIPRSKAEKKEEAKPLTTDDLCTLQTLVSMSLRNIKDEKTFIRRRTLLGKLAACFGKKTMTPT